MLHTNNEYRFGQIINDRKKLNLNPKFGGTRIPEEDIPTCIGVMKSEKAQAHESIVKTWQVMATYNKTNHIITLHVIEQNMSRKIDTKHICALPKSVVSEIHSVNLNQVSKSFKAFMLVEEISGWFTIMGLFVPEDAKGQTGRLITLRRLNSYLMNNPTKWGEDIFNLKKIDDFLIGTRMPFLKVYRLLLDGPTDEANSVKLKKICEDQQVDPLEKPQASSEGKSSSSTPNARAHTPSGSSKGQGTPAG